MKWAAGIFAAMLYLVWPYYTLLELTQAIRTDDAQAINRLVDWGQLRANLKAQLEAHLQTSAKTATERKFEKENPGFAALGNTLALTFANSLIDRALTPEGIVSLVQRMKVVQQAKPEGKPTKADTSPQTSLWQRIQFAFFVSPIHFRLDLSEADRGGVSGGASAAQPTLTVMLMFKGTGWQVYDVRFPQLEDLSSKLALAPN